MRLVRDTDYAWAAGFFDGEGCVSICKSAQRGQNNRLMSLKIIFTQLDPSPLILIKEIFNSDRPLQVVSGRGMQRDYHRLTFSGPTAAFALEKMLPYLTVKRQLAEVGIEFQKTINKFIRLTDEVFEVRMALYTKLKGLQSKRRVYAAAETNPKNHPQGGCDSPICNDDKVAELVRNN